MTTSKSVTGFNIALYARQMRATAAIEASSIAGEGALFLVRWLLRLLRAAALVGLWYQLGEHNALAAGASIKQLAAYTVLSEAAGDLLRMRTGMEFAFFNGSVALRLLRPFGLLQQFAAEGMGRALLGIVCFGAPLVVGAACIGIPAYPLSLPRLGCFLVSMPLAILTGLAMEYVLIGIGVVYSLHPYTVNNLREAAFGVLSGAFIPLTLLPHGVGHFAALLPFASQAAAPLEIATGMGAAAPLLRLQCFWAVTLWIAAAWVWRWNREKVVLYGG
jgi:ABC-type uncharacterized transport system permease subunit